MRLATIVVGSAFIGLTTPALGQVYKWVDERGVRHYGDRTQAQKSAAKVAIPSSPAAPAAGPVAPGAPASAPGFGTSRVPSTQDSKRAEAARAARQQTSSSAPKPTQQQQSEAQLRARALERCKANRGVDCDDPRGLQQWVNEERPITREQQENAAQARAARLRREREEREQRQLGLPRPR